MQVAPDAANCHSVAVEDYSSKATGGLVREVAEDARELVRKELELARRELVEAFGAKLRGAGLLAAAALVLLPGLVFLAVALALWVPLGPAAGFAVVGGGILAAGGLAVAAGIRLLHRRTRPPALESIKEDVRWARRRLTR
jgi:hypothetical protein